MLRQNGFILTGKLDTAASDGTPYYKIGESLVIMMPNQKENGQHQHEQGITRIKE